MVKNKFEKETIKLFDTLYHPVLNISMADPKDADSNQSHSTG